MNTFENIRLIVTDMDGTLLDPDRQLPENFFDIIHRLYDKGIRFAIASGRSYPTLEEQLHEVSDQLLFVAENGACIVDGRQLIGDFGMDQHQVAYLSGICTRISGVYPVYSCFHYAYVSDQTPESVLTIIHAFYADDSIRLIHSLDDIQEPVLKVTLCVPENAESDVMPQLADIPEPFHVMLGGSIWIDVFLDSCSKGAGIALMQHHYGITENETMIFGDYLNDLSMIPHAYYSYAMANSHPAFMKKCRFTTLSNAEDGVMHIVKKLL